MSTNLRTVLQRSKVDGRHYAADKLNEAGLLDASQLTTQALHATPGIGRSTIYSLCAALAEEVQRLDRLLLEARL